MYEERPLDDVVPARLAMEWSVPLEPLPVSFDGGALASDGLGHCITTSDYLDAQRIDRAGPLLRRELLPALGCHTLLLVPALLDEDTGHVDMFLQVLGPNVVGIASVDPDVDPDQAARLDVATAAVEAFAERRGLHWTIVRVAMGVDLSGDLFPYINGIHLPHAFLMPSYHPRPTPTETRAADALTAAMPGTRVVRIPAAQMADLGGALHCAVLGIRRSTTAVDRSSAAALR